MSEGIQKNMMAVHVQVADLVLYLSIICVSFCQDNVCSIT